MLTALPTGMLTSMRMVMSVWPDLLKACSCSSAFSASTASKVSCIVCKACDCCSSFACTFFISVSASVSSSSCCMACLSAAWVSDSWLCPGWLASALCSVVAAMLLFFLLALDLCLTYHRPKANMSSYQHATCTRRLGFKRALAERTRVLIVGCIIHCECNIVQSDQGPNKVLTCGKPRASADAKVRELFLAHFARVARISRSSKSGVAGLALLGVRSVLQRGKAA